MSISYLLLLLNECVFYLMIRTERDVLIFIHYSYVINISDDKCEPRNRQEKMRFSLVFLLYNSKCKAGNKRVETESGERNLNSQKENLNLLQISINFPYQIKYDKIVVRLRHFILKGKTEYSSLILCQATCQLIMIK